MNEAAILADIRRIIDENAALVGEKPELTVRILPDGRVRVMSTVGGGTRTYSSLGRCYQAALESNRRAHEVAQRIGAGQTFAEAIDATPVDPEWRTRVSA